MQFKVLKDKYIRNIFIVCGILILLSFIFVGFKFWGNNDQIIIHYDMYKGIDAIGNRFQLFGILISGLVMLGINFLLADFIYERERFFTYILSFASLIISILFLIAVGVIVSIN